MALDDQKINEKSQGRSKKEGEREWSLSAPKSGADHNLLDSEYDLGCENDYPEDIIEGYYDWQVDELEENDSEKKYKHKLVKKINSQVNPPKSKKRNNKWLRKLEGQLINIDEERKPISVSSSSPISGTEANTTSLKDDDREGNSETSQLETGEDLRESVLEFSSVRSDSDSKLDFETKIDSKVNTLIEEATPSKTRDVAVTDLAVTNSEEKKANSWEKVLPAVAELRIQEEKRKQEQQKFDNQKKIFVSEGKTYKIKGTRDDFRDNRRGTFVPKDEVEAFLAIRKIKTEQESKQKKRVAFLTENPIIPFVSHKEDDRWGTDLKREPTIFEKTEGKLITPTGFSEVVTKKSRNRAFSKWRLKNKELKTADVSLRRVPIEKNFTPFMDHDAGLFLDRRDRKIIAKYKRQNNIMRRAETIRKEQNKLRSLVNLESKLHFPDFKDKKKFIEEKTKLRDEMLKIDVFLSKMNERKPTFKTKETMKTFNKIQMRWSKRDETLKLSDFDSKNPLLRIPITICKARDSYIPDLSKIFDPKSWIEPNKKTPLHSSRSSSAVQDKRYDLDPIIADAQAQFDMVMKTMLHYPYPVKVYYFDNYFPPSLHYKYDSVMKYRHKLHEDGSKDVAWMKLIKDDKDREIINKMANNVSCKMDKSFLLNIYTFLNDENKMQEAKLSISDFMDQQDKYLGFPFKDIEEVIEKFRNLDEKEELWREKLTDIDRRNQQTNLDDPIYLKKILAFHIRHKRNDYYLSNIAMARKFIIRYEEWIKVMKDKQIKFDDYVGRTYYDQKRQNYRGKPMKHVYINRSKFADFMIGSSVQQFCLGDLQSSSFINVTNVGDFINFLKTQESENLQSILAPFYSIQKTGAAVRRVRANLFVKDEIDMFITMFANQPQKNAIGNRYTKNKKKHVDNNLSESQNGKQEFDVTVPTMKNFKTLEHQVTQTLENIVKKTNEVEITASDQSKINKRELTKMVNSIISETPELLKFKKTVYFNKPKQNKQKRFIAENHLFSFNLSSIYEGLEHSVPMYEDLDELFEEEELIEKISSDKATSKDEKEYAEEIKKGNEEQTLQDPESKHDNENKEVKEDFEEVKRNVDIDCDEMIPTTYLSSIRTRRLFFTSVDSVLLDELNRHVIIMNSGNQQMRKGGGVDRALCDKFPAFNTFITNIEQQSAANNDITGLYDECTFFTNTAINGTTVYYFYVKTKTRSFSTSIRQICRDVEKVIAYVRPDTSLTINLPIFRGGAFRGSLTLKQVCILNLHLMAEIEKICFERSIDVHVNFLEIDEEVKTCMRNVLESNIGVKDDKGFRVSAEPISHYIKNEIVEIYTQICNVTSNPLDELYTTKKFSLQRILNVKEFLPDAFYEEARSRGHNLPDVWGMQSPQNLISRREQLTSITDFYDNLFKEYYLLSIPGKEKHCGDISAIIELLLQPSSMWKFDYNSSGDVLSKTPQQLELLVKKLRRDFQLPETGPCMSSHMSAYANKVDFSHTFLEQTGPGTFHTYMLLTREEITSLQVAMEEPEFEINVESDLRQIDALTPIVESMLRPIFKKCADNQIGPHTYFKYLQDNCLLDEKYIFNLDDVLYHNLPLGEHTIICINISSLDITDIQIVLNVYDMIVRDPIAEMVDFEKKIFEFINNHELVCLEIDGVELYKKFHYINENACVLIREDYSYLQINTTQRPMCPISPFEFGFDTFDVKSSFSNLWYSVQYDDSIKISSGVFLTSFRRTIPKGLFQYRFPLLINLESRTFWGCIRYNPKILSRISQAITESDRKKYHAIMEYMNIKKEGIDKYAQFIKDDKSKADYIQGIAKYASVVLQTVCPIDMDLVLMITEVVHNYSNMMNVITDLYEPNLFKRIYRSVVKLVDSAFQRSDLISPPWFGVSFPLFATQTIIGTYINCDSALKKEIDFNKLHLNKILKFKTEVPALQRNMYFSIQNHNLAMKKIFKMQVDEEDNRMLPRSVLPTNIALMHAIINRQGSPTVFPERNFFYIHASISTYTQKICHFLKYAHLGDVFMTRDEYLKRVESSKRNQYKLGLEEFDEAPSLSNSYNVMVKTGEKQYRENQNKPFDLKPRLIIVPSFKARAVGSLFGICIQKALKSSLNNLTNDSSVDIMHGYIQGMNTTEISERMQKVADWMEDDDFIICSRDGSRFDSHQNVCLLEIDRIINNAYLEQHCLMYEYSLEQKKALKKLFDSKTANVTYTNRDKQSIFKLEIHGTVYSGHPTRTTWGNTIRSLVINNAMASEFVESKGQYFCFQCGDDTMEFVSRKIFLKYLDKMREWFACGDLHMLETHGVGMRFKELFVGETGIFCSLAIRKDRRQIISVKRLPTRSILSGSVSYNAGWTITEASYIRAVELGIKSQMHTEDMPIFEHIIKMNKKRYTKMSIKRQQIEKYFEEKRYSIHGYQSYDEILFLNENVKPMSELELLMNPTWNLANSGLGPNHLSTLRDRLFNSENSPQGRIMNLIQYDDNKHFPVVETVYIGGNIEYKKYYNKKKENRRLRLRLGKNPPDKEKQKQKNQAWYSSTNCYTSRSESDSFTEVEQKKKVKIQELQIGARDEEEKKVEIRTTRLLPQRKKQNKNVTIIRKSKEKKSNRSSQNNKQSNRQRNNRNNSRVENRNRYRKKDNNNRNNPNLKTMSAYKEDTPMDTTLPSMQITNRIMRRIKGMAEMCCDRYRKLMYEPFGGVDICYPDGNFEETFRTQAQQVDTFASSTASGYNYMGIYPSLVNDKPSYTKTTITFNGAALTFGTGASTMATGLNQINVAGLISTATMTTQNDNLFENGGRIAAIAISVVNRINTSAMSGLLYVGMVDQGAPVEGLIESEFAMFPGITAIPLNTGPCKFERVFFPPAWRDQGIIQPYSAATAQTTTPILWPWTNNIASGTTSTPNPSPIILIAAITPANLATYFEVEMKFYYEYWGDGFQASYSPVHGNTGLMANIRTEYQAYDQYFKQRYGNV